MPYEQVPQLYAQADVVVFPSIWPEPFGRIPLEAQAAGKPILSFRIGALTETTPQNSLLPLGNVAALRTAIQNCFKQKDTAPAKFNKYTPTHVSKQLLEVYAS